MKKSIIYLFALLFLISCGKDEEEGLTAEEYIATNNLTGFQQTSEGVYYKIENAGSSTVKPKIGDFVDIDYKGYYTDGEQFDSSYDRGIPFNTALTNVIQGWRIGIPLFGEGGSGTLIIPPNFGYGSAPPTGIRNNAVLIFEVEVVKVY